ncbi:ABC transporter ATP-binding protein [Thermogymnomonas acidicola]|uniref:ABC transporter ATP-binding protein n=1 Tax=Thermogymnomonas acidicola TaxID=399579 RepID=A0AA37BQA4_9ARCH|nr:ATP-binding cassette domain-containing protein [Thermogymnomonas acidicola]GGM69150.1 ABC transporter ATP-binding protein [Thermogymnomonas acidicola]
MITVNQPEEGTSTISVRSVSKSYGDVRALDSVSLEIRSGEIFGLLGPNGAGKTTLIKILTALVPPTSGEAFVAGYSVTRQPYEVKRRVGWVAAEVILDDDLTAMENLWLQAKLQNMSDWRGYAEELLTFFGLRDRADSKVKGFSTGMRKKLEIALALLHRPAVIFMDEPTIGLDPGTRRMLWDFIRNTNREYGVTVLLTTHYIEEADQLCDRIAIINHGKIAAVGTPAELKATVEGEVIEVEMRNQATLDGLDGLEGIREVRREGSKILISVPSSSDILPAVIESIGASNIRRISIHEPSLESAFLKITGKTIEEEESVDIRKFYANIRRARR